MQALKLSGDRKVAQLIRVRKPNPEDVLVRNAFGLPAGITCPGETEFCEGCYAKAIEGQFPNASKLLMHNWRLLSACGDDVSAMEALLDELIDTFVAQHAKREGRIAERRIFRIHWDGDFYSVPYAKAWARVVRANPDVQFWAYTRSFTTQCNVVPALKGLDNLALYLSVDRWNHKRSRVVLKTNPWLKVAACDDTQANAAELLPAPAPKCPENVKRLPLVVAMNGRRTTELVKGDDAQGACSSCLLCVDGLNNVRFAALKR